MSNKKRKTEGLSAKKLRRNLRLMLEDEQLVLKVEALVCQHVRHLKSELEIKRGKLDQRYKVAQSPTFATTSVVMGALKSAIDAHGPITRDWITSAAKRIVGQICHNGKPKKPKADVNG